MQEIRIGERIKEYQDKNKKVKKIATKYSIPEREIPLIILKFQIEKKYGSLEAMVEKLELENKELLHASFTICDNYYSDELKHELDKVIVGNEQIDEFYGGSGGSGDSNWIVLTPFYVSELMSKILEVNENSVVIDNCCGGGALLTGALNQGASHIIGIEYDGLMWSLSYLSLALRLGKRPNIKKGDAFELTKEFKNKADIAIVNPPYNYEGNGMPFILEALDNLKEGGRAAIIIQASAGTGRAVETNKKILEKHSLVGSIEMSSNLFYPFASVLTCIYFFEAHKPHDFEN